MKFNYYVQNGKAYISKKELVNKYQIPYTTLIYYLKKNKELITIELGSITFYKVKEVTDYLNIKLNKELNWNGK